MKKLRLLIEHHDNGRYSIEIKGLSPCFYGLGDNIEAAIKDLKNHIKALCKSYERGPRKSLAEDAVKLLVLLKELREFWG